jgi:regulator of protease activity HflC (stomatin/prohibitin superfamily)
MLAVAVIIVAVVALLASASSVRILKQYERGVQFRLGKVKDGARGPGLIVLAPLADRVRRDH